MFNPHGFVISINGEWGSGKSTILNYVKYYLNQQPEDLKPIIIEFNPWWFSGRDDLIRQLFMHFGKGISQNLKNAEKITELFGEYLLAFSSIIIPKAIHESINKGYTDSVEHIKKQFDPGQKSVEELKEEITKELSQDKKILVIIDDIDRLNPEEMRQLFQVIKTVADFPNVVFLLAFDKKIVTQILQESENISGEEYLEKIIQASFDVPYPERSQIKKLLSRRLEELFLSYNDDFFKDPYWIKIFDEGISELIDTPRDIIRFVNSISVTYPSVHSEVNPIDFIAIESLRIFQPDTYAIIRENPLAFAGFGKITDREPRYNSNFYEIFLSHSKTKKHAVDQISSLLFPAYCENLNRHVSTDWRLLRRDLRICITEIFPTYFWMTIPDYRIPHNEIAQLLDLTGDKTKFKSKLLEMASKDKMGGRKVNYILSRLNDYAENDIPLKNVKIILPELFDLQDALLILHDKYSQDANSITVFDECQFLRKQLLSRLNEQERYEIMKTVINSTSTFYSIVHDIRRAATENDNNKEKNTLTNEHIEDLKQLLILKLHKFADSNELLKSPNLKIILFSWYNWDTDKEVCGKWVRKLSNNDNELIKILVEFAIVEYHVTANDHNINVSFNITDLEKFVDCSLINCRIKEIYENKMAFSNLSKYQQEVIDKFLVAYLEKQKKTKQTQ